MSTSSLQTHISSSVSASIQHSSVKVLWQNENSEDRLLAWLFIHSIPVTYHLFSLSHTHTLPANWCVVLMGEERNLLVQETQDQWTISFFCLHNCKPCPLGTSRFPVQLVSLPLLCCDRWHQCMREFLWGWGQLLLVYLLFVSGERNFTTAPHSYSTCR